MFSARLHPVATGCHPQVLMVHWASAAVCEEVILAVLSGVEYAYQRGAGRRLDFAAQESHRKELADSQVLV